MAPSAGSQSRLDKSTSLLLLVAPPLLLDPRFVILGEKRDGWSRRGLPLEEQHPQRRQGEGEGVRPAMHGERRRLHAAVVPLAAAAIFGCVAVEQLLPVAAAGDADAVVLAH